MSFAKKSIALFITLVLILASVPQDASAGVVAKQNIGGTVTTVVEGGVVYKVHTFTSSGTFVVNSRSLDVWYLVIGGGGGGGVRGGGGGAGGYRTNGAYNFTVAAQSYPVTVGAGGAGASAGGGAGTNGGDSIFSTITATGGGGGGPNNGSGLAGGSGGGAGGGTGGSGGAGTGGQGNNGGSGGGEYGTGGGGGAGGTGGNGSGAAGTGGNGGAGASSSITGTAVSRAGGGAGIGNLGDGSASAGGGTRGVSGTANTGGGGGANNGAAAGNGGSGIVIIRYPVAPILAKTATGDGLVGWWTLDGADVRDKVYDRSGKGNHGYFYNGATTTTNVLGKLGKAFQFDGTDDYVNIADNAALRVESSPFTVSVWIYPTTIRQQMILFKSATNFSGSGYGLVMNRVSNDINLVKMGVIDQQVSYTFSVNRWYHVVARQNASSVDYFINGSSIGSFSNASAYQSSSGQNLYIGGGNSFMSQFAGVVDDPRIYNRALTYAEIQQLYQSSKNTVPKTKAATNDGLVARWTFDGADVRDKVYDRSGKGNHGYFLNGATSTANVVGKLGKAMSFDGSDDYFEKTSPSGFPSGSSARTFSAWIYPRNTNPGGIVMAIGDGAGGGQEFILSSQFSGGSQYLFTDGINGANNLTISGSEIPPANTWSHFAFIFNGGSGWSYYLNGTLKKSGTFTIGIDTSVTKVRIGERSDVPTASGLFPGLIDDVRIYNRALSAAEVVQLYNSR